MAGIVDAPIFGKYMSTTLIGDGTCLILGIILEVIGIVGVLGLAYPIYSYFNKRARDTENIRGAF